jgi:hypothetical protein
MRLGVSISLNSEHMVTGGNYANGMREAERSAMSI